MQQENIDALVSLTGELKANVILNNGLNNQLQRAAGGFMNRMEAQMVESKPNNAEQMGELIHILLGKSNADFETFCWMLRNANYGVWADVLEKQAKKPKGKSGTHVL